MWLAALPLLLIPACSAMLGASLLHPGIAVGRGAAWLLAIGCLIAALVHASSAKAVRSAPAEARIPMPGPSPAMVAALVVAWQVLTYLWHAPVHLPGAPWLLERAATAVCAWGLAQRLREGVTLRTLWGLAGAGAVVLIIAALADLIGPVGAVLGYEAPFGLSNFNVQAGMPLLGLGMALLWWSRPPWPAAVLLGLGSAALLVVGGRLSSDLHGYHLHLHEGVRGAAVEALAMGGLAVVLVLPRALHLPAVALAALVLLGGEAAVTWGKVDTTHFAPSTLQRVHLWRCAGEAISQAPLTGYGPGSAVAVLNQQPSFAACWLSVPSYPEHAHQELLEALLDGGLVNLALLSWLCWVTLAPLWRQRQDPRCAALLIGWAGFLSHAMLEVGLSQPGPLLMLSLLAGVSWALGASLPRPAAGAASAPAAGRGWWLQPASTLTALVCCAGLGLFLAGEMIGHLGPMPVGSVSELQVRADRRMQVAEAQDDLPAALRAATALSTLVGPLDIVDFQRAGLIRRISPEQLHLAVTLALAQAQRLPVLGGNLSLLQHLRQDCLRQDDAWDAERIADALAFARARIGPILALVPENDKNHAAYLDLTRFLPARPSPPALAPAHGQPALPAP